MLSLKDKVVFMSGAGSVGDDPDAKVWGNGNWANVPAAWP